MRTTYMLWLALAIVSRSAIAQNQTINWYFTANTNLYVPVNNPQKGVYPILWYDKEAKPKILIGGFGVGVAAVKPHSAKVYLKGNVNLAKHTYWDEATRAKDEFGSNLNILLSGSSDFSIDLTITAHYMLTNKLSIGSGLGSHVLLASVTRMPAIASAVDVEGKIYSNNYYKRIMPVIPLELSVKTRNKIFNIRYEHGLLNRMKRELGKYKKDHFGLLNFEVGFKIK